MTDYRNALSDSGLDYDTCVQNIIDCYWQASDSTREAGAQWYPNAAIIARDIARSADISFELACAIIAAFSPRSFWATNIVHATAFANGSVMSGAMRSNIDRANRVCVAEYQGNDPIAELNSTGSAPKVQAFANNIAGDHDVVTVDVWAMRVVNGRNADNDKILGRKGVYESISECFIDAADILGVSPATCQAVTWIHVRNGRAS